MIRVVLAPFFSLSMCTAVGTPLVLVLLLFVTTGIIQRDRGEEMYGNEEKQRKTRRNATSVAMFGSSRHQHLGYTRQWRASWVKRAETDGLHTQRLSACDTSKARWQVCS